MAVWRPCAAKHGNREAAQEGELVLDPRWDLRFFMFPSNSPESQRDTAETFSLVVSKSLLNTALSVFSVLAFIPQVNVQSYCSVGRPSSLFLSLILMLVVLGNLTVVVGAYSLRVLRYYWFSTLLVSWSLWSPSAKSEEIPEENPVKSPIAGSSTSLRYLP